MSRVCGCGRVDFFSYLTGLNDSAVTQQLMVGPTVGNGINMTVYIEGNTTTRAELGLVVYSDVDHNDTVPVSYTHLRAHET